jgi:hypothetical protein
MSEYEALIQKLEYCPDTGVFTWKSGRFKGMQAGSVNSHGYRYVKIAGRIYKCHRIAMLFHLGRWPSIVDHINGDRLDNRIANLREVTQSQNRMNAAVRRDSESGLCGVKWKKSAAKWRAEIKVAGKAKHLGYFDSKDDAIAARKTAEVDLFGEYARKNT